MSTMGRGAPGRQTRSCGTEYAMLSGSPLAWSWRRRSSMCGRTSRQKRWTPANLSRRLLPVWTTPAVSRALTCVVCLTRSDLILMHGTGATREAQLFRVGLNAVRTPRRGQKIIHMRQNLKAEEGDRSQAVAAKHGRPGWRVGRSDMSRM
jgi:hypothetical protein